MAAIEAASGGDSREAGSHNWFEWVVFGAILILAGALRMGMPGLTEFKADEARLLALAYDMAEGTPALRGISSSVGLPNFPASVWLYSIPAAIWPHPYAATIFTGLLSTLAVALTYWFVRRYWGTAAALSATLMYTVSPWAIIFSRKIWAQNLLPLFVLGWVISAALSMVEGRSRFLWLHLICLALAIQIHLSAVALVPATAVLLVVFRRNIRWRDVLIGGVLALLTVLPFAVYLLRNQNIDRLATGAAGAGTAGAISLDSLREIVTISLGRQLHSLAGAEAAGDYLAGVPDITIVHLIWGALIVAGVLLFAWRLWANWAKRESQVGLIILLWLAAPLLVFLWAWTPVFLHYFIAVLPAPYVAAGVAFSRLPAAVDRLAPGSSHTARRLVSAGAWGLLGLTAVLQLGAFLSLQNFVAERATPGGFGVPLAMKMEAVRQLEAVVEESGAVEALIAGAGEAPLIDEFAAEWDVLLHDLPHRFVDVTQSALFPEGAAVVLLDGRLDPEATMGYLYIEAGTAEEEIPLRSGEGSYLVVSLPGAARPTPDVAVEAPVLLANWVNLLGYDEPRRIDSKTAVWQIHWRTGDNPDAADYQFFNHLLDKSGERIGQMDGPAFDPQQWRAGDTVVSRFLMPWPEDAAAPLTMRVGMYRYPSLENVPLLDEAANPYSDASDFVLE